MAETRLVSLEDSILSLMGEEEDIRGALSACLMAAIRYSAHQVNMSPVALMQAFASTIGTILTVPPEDLCEFVAEAFKAEKAIAREGN